MSLFFRNWLDEGYYEEDSSGDLTRLEDPKDIRNAQRNGTLYHHDGFSFGKAADDELLNIEDEDN